tara:strand:+ start:951 stop:1187 length:237 start_codon:yes stop_codon:yes gene_type:complete
MKCFDYNKKNKKKCLKMNCKYWINCSSHQNCCIVAASSNKNLTLEEIGKIFKVTRMRICQIEKIAVNKVKDKIISFCS